MEKMREEFEAWAVKYNLARADWGNYRDRHVNNMWKAWQASRAAQCVELPDSERSLDCGDVLYRSDVEDAIIAAGIHYV